VNWSTTGNNITVQLNQTRTAGASVTYFPMPVVLRVANTGNTTNTFLTMYDRGDSVFVAGNGINLASGVAGHTISFTLPFAPATVSFDPNNVTMATGTTTKVTGLKQVPVSLQELIVNKMIIYPNPADDAITVQRNEGAESGLITITDMNGKVVLKKIITNLTEKINTQQLLPGVYLLQVTENGMVIRSEKLVIHH
jgi:hypothetical protein